MKIAIMQPYLFPYLGYFQLIKAVDIFVFYDDVNYINRGWINRNRILSNGKELLFTLPLKEASQNKLINEINSDISEKWKTKFFKTLHLSYSKAPYFKEVYDLIKSCLDCSNGNISSIAITSIINASNYLNLNTSFEVSSDKYADSKGLDRAHRLIEICKRNKVTTYINAIGGSDLYEKGYFNENKIELSFIKPKEIKYKQFKNDFVPWLSIIDVLMFNSVEQVNEMLDQYELLL